MNLDAPTKDEIVQLLTVTASLLARLLAQQPSERHTHAPTGTDEPPPQRFLSAWLGESTSFPRTPCLSIDLFEAFRRWCTERNLGECPVSEFVVTATDRLGCTKHRVRCKPDRGLPAHQSMVIFPPGTRSDVRGAVLDNYVQTFRSQLRADTAKVRRKNAT